VATEVMLEIIPTNQIIKIKSKELQSIDNQKKNHFM
jgi:hypothetical protein